METCVDIHMQSAYMNTQVKANRDEFSSGNSVPTSPFQNCSCSGIGRAATKSFGLRACGDVQI